MTKIGNDSSETSRILASKRTAFWNIQRRLTVAIVLAFAIPYLSLFIFANIVDFQLAGILDQTRESFDKTNQTLGETVKSTEQVFKLSSLDKTEMIAHRMSFIISMRGLIETQIAEDRDILEMIQSENIGEESQISIVNPLLDKIIADKYSELGDSMTARLPLVSKLINDKNYLKILSELDSGAPSLAGGVASISAQYMQKDDAEQDKKGESVFVVMTPIRGTPYSLSVMSSMGGVAKAALSSVEDSVKGIGQTLTQIDERTNDVLFVSRLTLILGALFGILIFGAVYLLIKSSILRPVDEITVAAEKIRRGEYDRRVDTKDMSGDMKDLALSINSMLDTITKLIQTEEAQKELQSNIINLLETVSRASDGDLSQRGEVTLDVLGAVADAFNLMLDNISRLIVQAKYAGAKVIQAATTIMSSMRRVAMDAKRQGREIHQLTTMIQGVSRSAQRVSLSADMANEESQHASQAAKAGLKTANETTRIMQTIRNNVQSTTKTIKTLGDRSFEINAIVELINDISSRTNILSLNATIEASKAGEQGKGFAVVADEIRKLAERTQNSTKEISSFIEDIQVETNDAVLAMEDVTREVEQGWKQVEESGSNLRKIESVITGAADKTQDISGSTRKMVSSMDQMVDQINSIFQVAKKTTEEIYQTTNIANSLLGPLETLNSVIQHFRVLDYFTPEDDVSQDELRLNQSIFPEPDIEDIVSQSDFGDSIGSDDKTVYVQTFKTSEDTGEESAMAGKTQREVKDTANAGMSEDEDSQDPSDEREC